MADGTVQVAPDSTGKKIDNTELTVGANVVERQRVQVAGASAADLADVRNAAPGGTDYGVVTRPIPSGTQGVNPTGETGGIGVGAVADAEAAAGNGSAIALLKRIRTLLSGGLPAALGAGGGLKVDGSGTALPVGQSGAPWGVNPTAETAGVGVGAAADAAAVGNGSVIGILKQLRTLLAGGLPAALSAGGGVKVGVVDALPAGANTIGNAVEKRALNKALAGLYFVHSGRLTVLAAAHASTAGFFWIVNTDAVKKRRIKRIRFKWNSTAASAFVSSPRVTVERVTFTGTPSGATITEAKRLTADSAPVGSVRTASTGLTLTAGAVIAAFIVGAVLTAVGVNHGDEQVWEPRSDDESLLELGQNEGLVFRQADAGSTSDTRVCTIDVESEEY